MEAASEYRACAICGRTMLRGEHQTEYVAGDGEPALVCALCKQRAEASGWVPRALAGAVVGADRGRRPRINLRDRFDRLARLGQPRAGDGEPASDPAQLARPRHQPEPALERRLPEPQTPPEPALAPPADPLEVFNDSEQARTVAGLTRSLGAPRISIQERDGGLLVTVAWELSWYQWEVEGSDVREVGKGAELDELGDADRDWNASAVEGGGVRFDGP